MSAPALLPSITTLDEYRPIYRDQQVWLPAMRAICQRHMLDLNELSFAPPGSNVVFRAGPGLLIKLFAPMWHADAAVESDSLDALSRQPDVNVPHIHARGEIEGWPYLVLTRVPGRPLNEIWGGLNHSNRLSIANSLGRCMRALHSVEFPGLEAGRAAWEAERSERLQACVRQQASLGVAPAWVLELAAWSAGLVFPSIRPDDLVLVNGDLNPEHLFCQQQDGLWNVTGVIDFADTFAAHPFYDFVRPGILFINHADLRRAMLASYGIESAEMTTELTRELFVYSLTHQYASLPEALGCLKQPLPANLRELCQHMWGF